MSARVIPDMVPLHLVAKQLGKSSNVLVVASGQGTFPSLHLSRAAAAAGSDSPSMAALLACGAARDTGPRLTARHRSLLVFASRETFFPNRRDAGARTSCLARARGSHPSLERRSAGARRGAAA